ncbi:MAG TPA: peptidylprolyl isomerase, partial [Dehalococcoidia bacterium]|nr:peptidylprolyl isomerase [Dehalococcoidia bacterium]
MSNQTLQKPPTKRRSQLQAAKGGQPRRQTARLEGRRDGKPLIFGWGAHLTRKQKNQIKERAAYSFAAFVAVAVVAVIIFGVIQQNYIIPNQTIATVNGVSIAQDTYRKQLAYDAQVLWNRIQNEYTQYSQLSTKAASGDQAASTQAQALQASIQADEGSYGQATITDNTMTELEEDQLIRQATKGEFAKDAAQLQPTAAAIADAVNTFKKSFPPNMKYSDFLSKNNMTEADVRTAATVQLRRNLMQTYLAAKLVSPTKQIHIRKITTSDAKSAATVREQILKNNTDQTWSTLAKQDSVDVDTKNTGGDAGWIYVGGNDGVIENWAFAPSTKVGDVSPV